MKSPNRHFYFAYGSNMNPDRVSLRNVNFDLIESGTLSGFYLAFNKRSVVYPGAASANIVKEPDNANKGNSRSVEGLIYHLADENQIEMMDPFEGYPTRYNRIQVEVKTPTTVRLVWTYMANLEYIQENLKPNKWYLDHLLAGRPYMSKSYYDQLTKTICLPDSNIELPPQN